MGYLQREFATYGVAWLAMASMLAGVLYFKWTGRGRRHVLFLDGSVLHAHLDVIHAHRQGEHAHWHAPNGQPVLIRR
jgi:hypothetical protein